MLESVGPYRIPERIGNGGKCEVYPPKPSTRLTLNQPTLSTRAASRRTEPKRLGTLVQGELDWIIMKFLEKDRKRRYEPPTSLADDIQAHLQGEPVQAARPNTAYRIQKFVRKHRGPVVAVTAIGMILITVFAKVVRPESGAANVVLVEWGPDNKPADKGLIVE